MVGKDLFTHSALGKTSLLLQRRDRRKLFIIVIAQILTSFLDLLGVVLVGALGALSVQGIETRHAGNKVNSLLTVFHIQDFSFQNQVAILGTVAGLILITKTILSIYLTRKTLYYLGSISSKISGDLISKILSLNLIELEKRTSQEILYIVSTGAKNLLIGILATTLIMISDFSILVVMALGLLFVDPGIAIASIILFTVVGAILHFLLQVRAKEIGVEDRKLNVASNQKILEALNSYRESVVRNRRQFYAHEIRKQRYILGELTAELNFQPYISKYVMESSAILGSLVLAGYEFGTKNAVHAVSILTLFIAATSRIAPAALRIQQGLLTIKNSSGSTESTLRLIDDLANRDILESDEGRNFDLVYDGFTPTLKITNLNFKYNSESDFSIKNINLEIPEGSSLAIVGPSGSGKSTLIDLILGVLEPQSGSIRISGVTPLEVSKIWPGAISYVPQNIFIADGTVRENIGQGFPKSIATDVLVSKALKFAQLSDTVSKMPHGVDSEVGESGAKISGGQRQRLGIARALFTCPKFLVMDEATSSLDGQVELEIAEAITKMSGRVTTITVAHRLSTVRNADKVIYVEDGKIIAEGKFSEVRQKVPNFDSQAKLMGI